MHDRHCNLRDCRELYLRGASLPVGSLIFDYCAGSPTTQLSGFFDLFVFFAAIFSSFRLRTECSPVLSLLVEYLRLHILTNKLNVVATVFLIPSSPFLPKTHTLTFDELHMLNVRDFYH